MDITEDTNIETKINEAITKIFDDCGIKADIEISLVEDVHSFAENHGVDVDNTNSSRNEYHVNIKSEESSILIGYHGETLSSLEHIVNLILFKATKTWQNVRIDISDYKRERKARIIEIADNAVNKAKFLKKSIALLPMNNFERKIIHEHISSNYPEMESYSEGESYNRRVVIAAKEIPDTL